MRTLVLALGVLLVVVWAASGKPLPGILTVSTVFPLAEIRLVRELPAHLQVCAQRPRGDWLCRPLSELRGPR